ESWPEERWLNFLNQYFVKNPHNAILGVPSQALSEKLRDEEAKRIEERLKELGPSGLKELERKLEAAKTANSTPIPDSVFQSLPVPSSDSIPWMKTVTAKSGLARSAPTLDNNIQKIVDEDSQNFP